MMPSLHFVSKEDLVLPRQVYFGMILVSGSVLLGEWEPMRCVSLATKMAATALSVYCAYWLHREWYSFDEEIQQECGFYIPLEEEKAAQEPLAKDPKPTGGIPRVSSYSCLSETDRNRWRMILVSGAPF